MISACAVEGAPIEGTDLEVAAPARAPDPDDTGDGATQSEESGAAPGNDVGSAPSDAPAPAPQPPPSVPPPAGTPLPGGLRLLGKMHFKSEAGGCAQVDRLSLRTAPCADIATQLFPVYEMANGNLELCLPETLVPVGSPATAYQATCLSRTGDSRMELIAVTLSKADGPAWLLEPGHLIKESDGTFGWLGSGRRLTKDGTGLVILAKVTGTVIQKWTLE